MMPISRVNFQNVAIPPATDSGGGGAPAGTWTDLSASDLQINKQGYTTFSLSASPVSGYNHRITIGADTGRAANSTDMAQNALLYFDTGISVNSLTNGDGSTGVTQILFEPAGVDGSSSYRNDTTYPLAVVLFSSITPPPFGSGSLGYFGHGFFGVPQGSVNNAFYAFPRKMRTTRVSSIQASLFGFANPLKSLVHTTTFAQTVTSNTKALALTQSDFHGSFDDTANGLDSALIGVSQITDSVDTRTTNGSDTILVGCAFQVGVTSDGTNKTWDFNLKYRSLFFGA